MSLTELQALTTFSDFMNPLKAQAAALLKADLTMDLTHTFIARVTTADLSGIGITSAEAVADLIKFRTLLEEFNSFMNGNTVTPSNSPKEVLDKIRNMAIM